MHRFLMVLCLTACVRAAGDERTNALAQFSSGLERLAATVAPAVVQVQVTGWCASASANGEDAAILASCRVVGSGVIVDPSGYIITNEHVVRNARRIRVMLTPKSDHSGDGPAPAGKQPALDAVVVGANREPLGRRDVLNAVVVGTNRETDIALLKIETYRTPRHPARPEREGPPSGAGCAGCRQPRGSRQYDDDRNRQRRRPAAASGLSDALYPDRCSH